MRTVLINASPKHRFSASSYFLALQRLFLRGNVVSEKLRSKKDYDRILNELGDTDAVVFCLPLYVDGVPSHVLLFLKEMENFCRRNAIRPDVYCIANNGFIEGKQNEPLMQVFRNFSARSELNWCGGIGIGGGVMLSITRILFAVNAAVFCFNMIWNGIQNGTLTDAGTWRGFLLGAGILVFLNLGVLIDIFRMGRAMNKGDGHCFGEK
ncbi:MAG: hypothetical protein LUB60_05735 [Clostridiales bacterium]|nr:hypothetical protein [Clostridiales bacterium]